MLLFDKYGQHQPLIRQADRFTRESAPLIAELRVRVTSQFAKLSRGHDLAKAINYMLRRCPGTGSLSTPLSPPDHTITGWLHSPQSVRRIVYATSTLNAQFRHAVHQSHGSVMFNRPPARKFWQSLTRRGPGCPSHE
jgi:hypothetical protein